MDITGQKEVARLTVDNVLRGLASELAAGGSSRLVAWMEHCASFYRYSSRNQMLIQHQRPSAGRVASKGEWTRRGLTLRADAKGIVIWAYFSRSEKSDDDTDETPVKGGFFRPVFVYDESAVVEQDRLPSVYDAAAGEDHAALVARLEAAMRAGGLTIKDAGRDRLGTARGQVNSGGTVEIGDYLTTAERFGTLAHEWAHALLGHTDAKAGLSIGEIECQAEATAYVVCKHFGVTRGHSSDYLTSWRVTPKALGKQLDAVQRAARAIIGALEDGAPEKEEAA